MALINKVAERGTDDIEERFGFVVMLDGLGVGHLEQSEQWAWLDKRNEMIYYLIEQQQFHLKRFGDEVGNAHIQASKIGMPPAILSKMQTSFAIYKEIQDTSSFATFGDTIIFHGSVSANYIGVHDNFDAIAQISFSLMEIMKANIKFDLRLRGSFALGNFLTAAKSDTIMGKALIDAYRSYERANWIGIVAAPGETEDLLNNAFSIRTRSINQAISKFGVDEVINRKDWWNLGISYKERLACIICDTYIKYPISYRNPEQENYQLREMWTLAWPLIVHLDRIIPENIINIPMSDKKKADTAILTIYETKKASDDKYHQKYDNTIKFYNDIWKMRRSSLEPEPNRTDIE